MSREDWAEQPLPEHVAEMWASAPSAPPRYLCHRWEKLIALVSRDEIEPGDLRWHISLRHEKRIPTWDELAACGHDLRPGVCFCIGVPPRSWWMNLHENVLHLWELRDQPIMAQWRAESQQGRTPPTKGGV